MFVVILAQSAATSRAYATRYGERFSENVDLVGLSLANIGAGLSGTFVVNGSPTKTQMVDSVGGRSQLAQITTCVIVLAVLLFLTGLLSYMPDAVLSAVVFLIGNELVDVKGMRRILAERPVEFWVALITLASVVFIGVEQGILLAMVLSLLAHTRHGYRAKNLVIEKKRSFYGIPLDKAVQTLPDSWPIASTIVCITPTQSSCQRKFDLARLGPVPVAWFCIDLLAVDDVDFSAAAALREVCTGAKERHIRPVFSRASDHVRREPMFLEDRLDRAGRLLPDLRTVLEIYQQQVGIDGTR
jgi:MFS superfamily sulfate permease-like transporter